LDGSIRTPGQRALIDWIAAAPNRSQGSVARALGISQPAVGYWVRGVSRPGPGLREALAALCGIAESDWELESERTQRAEALARIAAADKGAA
jgi:transcriptional regulator with XRE-family HTH domain